MKNSKIANHFDKVADSYDKFKEKNYLYYDALKIGIKNEIVKPYQKIIDIGCGTGNMIDFLNPRVGVGIDISRKMLKIAKDKYKTNSNYSFKYHDIEKAVINEKFDYILFNDVIEHLTDQDSAINNISRSMSKKTILILSMANPLWEPLLIILEKLKLKMPEGPHNRISEKNLFIILRKYRLKVISKKVYFPRIKIPIICNLGLIYVYKICKVK